MNKHRRNTVKLLLLITSVFATTVVHAETWYMTKNGYSKEDVVATYTQIMAKYNCFEMLMLVKKSDWTGFYFCIPHSALKK